ncbi:MAG: inositol monophosphatase [Rhodospirillaceae bacterium]|jgi:myo-inositol-1(or 4)-monophosphatase|nr:inositol monophosphatase [Rhodospirillaceae bacterium]MBT5455997.1 inositol monophosphatase [Rhodospirillaceae bacterium]
MRPAIINVMDGAARKAARSLIHDFGEVEQLQVSRKGPADFVSEADRRAEEILRRELGKARPGFSMLLEEAGAVGDSASANRWIVDPLDGTTNFLHGIPHFAISIAHEEDGELVAGMIYDPLRDESFWSVRGSGAFLNNHRLRVSARKDMGDAVLATGLPFGDRPGKQEALATLEPVMAGTAGLRRFGAASLDLAYVAAGRFDAFWEFGLSPWDVAAGILLIREAGGFVTELDGGNDPLNGDTILAANDALYDPVGRMLREAIKAKTP